MVWLYIGAYCNTVVTKGEQALYIEFHTKMLECSGNINGEKFLELSNLSHENRMREIGKVLVDIMERGSLKFCRYAECDLC